MSVVDHQYYHAVMIHNIEVKNRIKNVCSDACTDCTVQ